MIIVTGGNGFIGSALVSALNDMGRDDLLITDFIPTQERPGLLKNKKFVQFIQPDDLLPIIGHSKIECIFHIGACSSTTETDWNYLKQVNLDYSKKLFSLCAENKIDLFYASSGAVYGDGKLGFDDASDTNQFAPLNLYGKSKSEMDIWASEQKLIPPRWMGLRYFNVYGPNEYHKGDMASVAYKAFLQIRQTGKLKLFRSKNPKYKDGQQKRDFVYVKDITKWMLELWKNKTVPNGIYNMGTGKAATWLDLAESAFKALSLPMNIDWIEMPETLGQQYQYFTEAKMTRLYKAGLTKPTWDVKTGVTNYFQNYLLKDNPYV